MSDKRGAVFICSIDLRWSEWAITSDRPKVQTWRTRCLIAVPSSPPSHCVLIVTSPTRAQDKSIVVASTTSTQDSGLFEYLMPIFKQKTGITVKVLAQGTGQALDTARRGDADVVFVHAKSAEEKFLAEGEGVKRFPVMYNDFVVIGPTDDPAGIKGMKDVAKAFQVIKGKQACFVSRGDHSGTHIAELSLWKAADIDIEKDRGPWYKSIGQGMGAALGFANQQIENLRFDEDLVGTSPKLAPVDIQCVVLKEKLHCDLPGSLRQS
jgi:ABC-type tungstate transport system permease subunit